MSKRVDPLTKAMMIQAKKSATKEASDIAYTLMLAIPALVIHDHFGELMRREVDGKGRVERFVELCIEHYDHFDKGYLTLKDMHQLLKDEAGVTISKGARL